MDALNPFATQQAARLYAEGRPYHHRRTIQRALALLDTAPAGYALDVACGTGMSTRALSELGYSVVGMDSVKPMVEVASRRESPPFLNAVAESMPIRDDSVSLVTVASGVHWFDQALFYKEALRVLHPQGVLLLYEHAAAHLPDDPSFLEWVRDEYVSRYPSPTRGPMTGATEPPSPWRRVGKDSWIDQIELSHEDLVAYLLSQGNFTDVVVTDELRRWVALETAPFFRPSNRRLFSFFAMAEAFVPE